jgi:hypothetical protein
MIQLIRCITWSTTLATSGSSRYKDDQVGRPQNHCPDRFEHMMKASAVVPKTKRPQTLQSWCNVYGVITTDGDISVWLLVHGWRQFFVHRCSFWAAHSDSSPTSTILKWVSVTLYKITVCGPTICTTTHGYNRSPYFHHTRCPGRNDGTNSTSAVLFTWYVEALCVYCCVSLASSWWKHNVDPVSVVVVSGITHRLVDRS